MEQYALVTRSRRNQYKEAAAAVRDLINTIDPIGLMGMGAPQDEYDPEVADLVRLVMRSDRFDEHDVDAIWRQWFGDDYADAPSLAVQAEGLHRLQELYGEAQ